MNFFRWWFGPLNRNAFARKVQRELSRAYPGKHYVYDETAFAIRCGEERDWVLNLHNFYAEYLQLTSSKRHQVFRNLVRTQQLMEESLPEDLEEARPHLMPKIWTRGMIDRLTAQKEANGKPGLDLPLVPMGEHFYLSVVYDDETAMRTLDAEALANWGLTTYEALEIARENLESKPMQFAGVENEFYVCMAGDCFEAARAILTDRLKQLSVKGDLVIMIPNRDSLLVSGSESEIGLTALADLSEETLQAPRPMVATPLILKDDEWMDWMPEVSHPAYARLHQIQMRSVASLYADQAEVLNEGNEFGAYAAHVLLTQDEAGVITSLSQVSKGVKILLPKTQRVAFFNPETREVDAVGEWEQVMSVAGELFERRDDLYPVRYLVVSYPSQEVLESIGKNL